MDQRSKSFDVIVGEKLSAITFVLDYWQLQFDGPVINALTRMEVDANGMALRDGHDQFRNLICEQIGKVVTGVALLQREVFTIAFEDQSLIKISLRWEDYRGPEAMTLFGPDGSMVVVRADD